MKLHGNADILTFTTPGQMSWIHILSSEQATGTLRRLYDRISGPDGHIDNILQVHSLRPHTLKGHMALYKNVLHHADNTLPKWFLETIGIYVSVLNACDYCVQHHLAGLHRLLEDDQRTQMIRKALESDQPGEAFDEVELAFLMYARKLTLQPMNMTEDDIAVLRGAGAEDGEILEVNQVVSYFAYANRTVLGLGVHTTGDILGLSPGTGGEEDWSHA